MVGFRVASLRVTVAIALAGAVVIGTTACGSGEITTTAAPTTAASTPTTTNAAAVADLGDATISVRRDPG